MSPLAAAAALLLLGACSGDAPLTEEEQAAVQARHRGHAVFE